MLIRVEFDKIETTLISRGKRTYVKDGNINDTFVCVRGRRS